MRKVLLSLVALVATILGAKAQIVYTNLESTPIVLNSAKTDATINFLVVQRSLPFNITMLPILRLHHFLPVWQKEARSFLQTLHITQM